MCPSGIDLIQVTITDRCADIKTIYAADLNLIPNLFCHSIGVLKMKLITLHMVIELYFSIPSYIWKYHTLHLKNIIHST